MLEHTDIGMVSLRVLDFSISLSIWYAVAFSFFSTAQSHWFAPTTPTPKHPRTPIDTHIMCGFPSLHGMRSPCFFPSTPSPSLQPARRRSTRDSKAVTRSSTPWP